MIELGIAFLSGQIGPAGATGNTSIRMAAVTMALLPVLLVFLLAQRWIIQVFAQTNTTYTNNNSPKAKIAQPTKLP